MSIKSRLLLLIIALSPATLLADSMAGVTTQYTTDCPTTKTAIISVRYAKGFDDVSAAASYEDKAEREVKALLSKIGVKDTSFTNGNFSVDMRNESRMGERVNYWRAKGQFSFTVEGAKAPEALKMLVAKAYKASMQIRSNKPSKCKK